MADFKGRHFTAEAMLWAVRWYLMFPVTYRHLELMLADRDVEVDHTTIFRSIQAYAAELEKRLRPHLRSCNGSWRVYETYIKIRGRWTYLYRDVDDHGQTIDFLLSPRRDAAAAKRLVRKALGRPHAVNPRTITVDRNAAYPKAAAKMKGAGELWRRARLRHCKYLNNITERDRRRIKRLTGPGLGFGCARQSWRDPAGASPAQVRGSARLVASVASWKVTTTAKRTMKSCGVCIEPRNELQRRGRGRPKVRRQRERRRYARHHHPAGVEDQLTHERIASEPGRPHFARGREGRRGPRREIEETKPSRKRRGIGRPNSAYEASNNVDLRVGGGDGGGKAVGRRKGKQRRTYRTQCWILREPEATRLRIGGVRAAHAPNFDRARPPAGARCGKAARQDLSGGTGETRFPTAISFRTVRRTLAGY